MQRYYRASARELQRLNSISKSPIYSAFTEALNGCATIQVKPPFLSRAATVVWPPPDRRTTTVQAFGSTERFCELQRSRFDFNLKAAFGMEAVGIWLQVMPQAPHSGKRRTRSS